MQSPKSSGKPKTKEKQKKRSKYHLDAMPGLHTQIDEVDLSVEIVPPSAPTPASLVTGTGTTGTSTSTATAGRYCPGLRVPNPFGLASAPPSTSWYLLY